MVKRLHHRGQNQNFFTKYGQKITSQGSKHYVIRLTHIKNIGAEDNLGVEESIT